MKHTELQTLLKDIWSTDAETSEEAYFALAGKAHEIVPELLAELRKATDAFTRGKFIELLGDSRRPQVTLVLAAELRHEDQSVRQWAVSALREIGTPIALAFVTEYEQAHPEEF
jgi:HEAT repeat protein